MALFEGFHRRRVFPRRVRVLADLMAELLPRDAIALDVGCGDGAVGRTVMELRPDIEIVGIDVLVRPVTKIPVTVFDGVEIPHDDGSFDVVMFVDVLHHTENPTVLLREAARVARRAVVLKDHLADPFLARSRLRMMDWVGNAQHGVALPYNYWSTGRWYEAFTEVGLSVDRWTTDVPLYPAPASLVFGRELHMACRLVPTA